MCAGDACFAGRSGWCPSHERAETVRLAVRFGLMLRELMFAEIEKVERGEDPMGVIRDPDHEMIDTNLQESITMSYPTGIRTREVAAGK